MAGANVTISGTASDSGGGVVAGVEVSTDGGATWHPATGRSNWSYTWVPSAAGPYTLKSRAVDDSGNLETASAGVQVTVSSVVANATIWPSSTTPAVAADSDSSPQELGVKFRSDNAGYITGIRFYKGPGNSGTHVGDLWTTSGTLLASATFTSETASGWQQVDFAQPVQIQANTTYVASYFDPNGHFSVSTAYFSSSGVDSGVLHALSNAAAGGNGVFRSGSAGFPNSTFNGNNYWVDVVFSNTLVPTITARTPGPDATGVNVNTPVTATFHRPLDPTTVNTSTVRLRAAGATSDVPATVSYAGSTATLQPSAALTVNKVYQVTVSGSVTGADGTPVGSDITWSFTTQPYLTFNDTMAADFGGGTTDAGTAVVQTGDGEVSLNPAAGSDFSGTAVTGDWMGTAWSGGGAVTVSGGVAVVDGAFLRTNTLYGPGHSLEFLATFSNFPFQHAGFANDLSTGLYAMFSTMSGGGLWARTAGPGTGGGSIDTQLASGLLGGPHRFRIDWTATSVNYFIDGAPVASHNLAVTSSMRPMGSDANVGGGALTVDWMRMTPYAASGTYLSRVLDAGGMATWVDASWTAGLPSGTSLAMSVRRGNTATPDGTWTDWITLANSGASIGGSTRYLQYRADLATTSPDQTPTLQSVAIEYAPIIGPAANNDTYTTSEDTALTLPAPGVLSNDTSANGGNLTAVLVSGPAHGTLTLNADGSFSYTPAANYNGSDSFAYKANDGSLDGNTATVSLTVTAVNDAPVAANDSQSTAEDTSLTISAPGVLGNDTDVEGSPLTAVLVAGPAHGTVTLNADGSFTYTPAANYNGSDSFTYMANDGALNSSPATVSLTITPVNDAPVAVNDSYTTAEDTVLTVAAPGVRANDFDVDGDPINALLVEGPLHGTVTWDGTFTYTPAPNYNGSDFFTYRDIDPSGALSSVATVSLTITPVNDPPVAANDNSTTAEDTPLTVSAPGVLGNDSDVDGDALTAVLVAGPAHGTLALNANGSFTYNPAANYNGADSFTYKARDLSGALSGVGTVSLTVTPVNDPPVAANESYTTAEEAPLTLAAPGVLANDTDVDGDALTAVLVTGPAHGTLTLNSSGSYTYTPAAAYNGPDSFTYKARDPSGALSNAGTVTFTVTPPTLSITNVSANEGNLGTTPFTFTVTLSSPTSRTISVNYATADGTANSMVLVGDYAAASGTLVFQGGQTSKTITVNVNGDLMQESNETFFVNLSNANTPMTKSQGVGTILNDDSGLLVLAGEEVVGASEPALTPEELAPIVSAAEARWAATGMDAASLDALKSVEFRIADLPNTDLGATTTGVIYIDVNAAGHGWFIDATPADDKEFSGSVDPAVAGRVDLLSVVAHEMGHAMGLEHAAAGVMQEALPVGVRHSVGCNCPLCQAAASAALTASAPAPEARPVITAGDFTTAANFTAPLGAAGSSDPGHGAGIWSSFSRSTGASNSIADSPADGTTIARFLAALAGASDAPNFGPTIGWPGVADVTHDSDFWQGIRLPMS
ncbi:MAG TPA: tandem-95 repeat protein [Gemmataceae bacterium]|nr:tandem-95 repeat protein [Gemmataceae bacterium]